MMDRRWLLPVALLCVSCVTATPPSSDPPRATPADPEVLRSDLELAWGGIVAREQHPGSGPEVDVEAAASIPMPDHRSIHGAVQYFSTSLRDKIQTSLLRATRYRSMIDAILDEHALPKALAYLPVIESAYIPTLTSRAGAHGLWQFMPATAREYGLRVDWWIDERADPEKSTAAAAAFLTDLYREFGDWSLALAAYNCGPGRVRRALESTGATTFWELLERSALPKETRGYVPTFYATLHIAGDPEAYGFRLEPHAPADLGTITVDGPLSLRFLAGSAGLSESELQELNPALHRGLVPPGRRNVTVPAAAAPLLAEVAATLREDDTEIDVAALVVRKGDTVTRLARRFGTQPGTILEMNDLRPGDSLRAGRSIYVPVNARRLGTLLRHADDEDVFHTVRKGDTLSAIARKHKLSVGDLCELNDLRKDAILQPGQKLRVTPPRGLTAGGM
ncbi:MAG TPA: LysM peptidoglycan-binding domain-containing protein [Thermoanaerobaculia bacterium]|nr:LysM peptidoglycan-binding domain-containing protein [Thermoanaerobaculia bacterium]